MPTILIIAGPNGAGKTTFANQYFSDENLTWPYLNADEISREPALTKLTGPERDIRAGRLLLERLEALVEAGEDFALETTLSSRLYARRIPDWRTRGYQIELMYLRLIHAEASLMRVRRRVARGGHGVPPADLRRRFGRSLWNLENVYKPLVDGWRIWESREGEVILVDRSNP